MRQRGRKSAAAGVVAVISEPRLKPPAELDERQRNTWLRVTGSRPGNWFDAASEPLLKAYCQHIAIAAEVDEQITRFDRSWIDGPGGLERFEQLLKARERETRMIAALARSLRLTPQSLHNETASRAVGRHREQVGPRPWDA